MRHIAGYVTLHETISALRNDLHELVRGRLPPHLIDAGTIQRVIQGIFSDNELSKQGFSLCYTKASDVYADSNFDLARHEHDIFVRVRFPYTKHPKMNMFELTAVPMQIPGNQNLITMVKELPKYIATHIGHGLVGEVSRVQDTGILDREEVRWHARDMDSYLY